LKETRTRELGKGGRSGPDRGSPDLNLARPCALPERFSAAVSDPGAAFRIGCV